EYLLGLVALGAVVHAGVVADGVVAELVPGGHHLLDEVGVRRGLRADHAEDGLDVVLLEDLQDLRGPHRVRAVVNGDVEAAAGPVRGVHDGRLHGGGAGRLGPLARVDGIGAGLYGGTGLDEGENSRRGQ